MSETWINADGLAVKFGTAEAVKRNIGAYGQVGPVHFVEILIDHSELPLVADGPVILNDNFALPAGAKIERVLGMSPTESFVSPSNNGVLNIGLIDQDDRSSNGVTAALVNAATQTELNAFAAAGTVNASGTDGSAVGTVLSQAKLLTWEVDTNQFSAGTTTVRIEWTVPPKNGVDTLVWNKSA